jgi:hypothetical protein
MSKTTEVLEHMEHVGHAGHGDHGDGHGHEGDADKPKKPSLSKFVGITMAVLGVLLAICSALVGEARTELIAKMVEKTNVTTRYQAVSTKFRLLQANLQQMNALLPADPVKFKQLEGQLADAQARVTGDAQPLAAMVRASHDQTIMAVVPTTADLKRFVEIARAYKAESKAAYTWKESFNDLIEGYEHAGHHYEWGMLAAEIGIIIASIALLLGSRLAWLGSVGLGALCVVIVAITNVAARSTTHRGEEAVTAGRAAYHAASSEDRTEVADEALFKSIEAMK